jgi:hypothetical protein
MRPVVYEINVIDGPASSGTHWHDYLKGKITQHTCHPPADSITHATILLVVIITVNLFEFALKTEIEGFQSPQIADLDRNFP